MLNEINRGLRDICEELNRGKRELLHTHGLTPQQWDTLHALKAHNGGSPGKLAEVVGVLGPSMSRILRDLSVEGYVTIGLSSADNRGRTVKSTAKCRRLLRKLSSLVSAVESVSIARAGTARVKRLAAALEAI